MKTAGKKVVLAAVIALVLAISSIALVACGKTSAATVEGFADKTDTVVLGDTYTFDETQITDSAGVVHRIDFSVKTSSGTAVSVAKNGFIASSEEGYVAVCTIEAFPALRRTITITVVSPELKTLDGADPATVMPTTGREGMRVTLPQLKAVKKGTDEVLCEQMTARVTFRDTEIGTNVDSFTPEAAGLYSVRYQGKIGNSTFSKAYEIDVLRAEPKAREVEGFDSPSSVYNFSGQSGLNETKTWLPSFEGESGVLQVTIDSAKDRTYGWPQFYFTQRRKMADYAGYDYIVFRIYVGKDNEQIKYLRFGNEHGDEQNLVGEDANTVVIGAWHDYVFSTALFNRFWKDDGNDPRAMLWSEYNGNVAGKRNLYFADISVYKKMDETVLNALSVTASANSKEGEAVSFTVGGVPQGATPLLTVTDPVGNEHVVSGNAFTPTTDGTYTATLELDGYLGKKTVTFTVAATKDIRLASELPTTLSLGKEVTLPAGYMTAAGNDTKLADMQPSVTYNGQTVQLSAGKFTVENVGDYVITYACEYDGNTFTRHYVVKATRTAPKANEVESFDHVSSLDWINSADSIDRRTFGDPTWHDSFEGASGVLQLTYRATCWPRIYFMPRQEMSAYDGYEYLVIRAFVTGDVSTIFLMNQTSNKSTDAIRVRKGQWHDYVFPMAKFKEFWGENREHAQNAFVVFVGTNNGEIPQGGEATVYVDDISVAKGVPSESITVTVSDTPTAGQPVTFTVSVPQGETATLTVFDADGGATVLEGNTFTPPYGGSYTLNVGLKGYVGAKAFPFTVKSDYTFRVENFPTQAYEDSRVTVPAATLVNSGNTALDAVMLFTVKLGGKTVTVDDDNAFVAEVGVYTVVYTAFCNGALYTSDVYTITVTRPVIEGSLQSEYGTITEGTEIDVIPVNFVNVSDGNKLVATASTCTVTAYSNSKYMANYTSPIVTNGKITLPYAGAYTLKYTATVNGRTYEKEVTVNVQRNTAAIAEIESFDSPEALSWTIDNAGIASGEFKTMTWLDTYESESGVMKVTFANTWPQLYFKPRKQMQAYTGYYDFVIRMYVPAGSKITTIGLSNLDGCPTLAVQQGQWHDYVFDAKWFRNAWKDNGSYKNDGAYIWTNQVQGAATAEVYVADISVRYAIPATEVESYHSAHSIGNFYRCDTKEWQESYTDSDDVTKEGVIKLTTKANGYTEFSFTPRNTMQSYKDGGYNYIVITVCFAEGTYDYFNANKGQWGAGVAAKQPTGAPATSNKWVKYYWDISCFTSHWKDGVINTDGGTEAKFWIHNTASAAGTVYIADISVASDLT